ncbi:uncharacterized protein LOC116302789 [Actinia tenebrosa]|uniref:Uncharacterized protein LOC116302789 n=1 Tax=Actinia tenebrosa TaxID=6105 RepID=A0A6P8INS1_ACTTE|nr:uncharacterized protein LOC116302789 [Actinia tenebrosa]
MRPNTSVKYSLFLIFLTLGHEFGSAYRLYERSQHRWSADALKQPEFQEPKFSEPLPYGEDFKGFENKRSENGTGVEVVNRQKRWAAAVALGAGVAISLGGIGFEVYLKLATCCGPYPEICTYIEDFKAVQKRLKPMFPKVDFLALTAKNTLEDITQTNYRLIEIWNDMKRIRDLKVKLLEKISSATIKFFNTKWAEIETQLRKANNTVRALTYEQLSAEFGSFLDNYKSALLGFTPLFVSTLTLAAIPAYNAYKKASLNKEIARLSTGQDYKQLVTARHGKASKVLGVQNLNQHIKATATSRNNARFATGKYTQYALNGITGVSVLISLGVEIYAAYKKLEQCREQVRKDAKKGLDDVVKGEKLLIDIHKNLTGYMTMIDEKGVKYLKGELSSQNVLVELEAIRKLAKGAGQKAQSKNLTIAAQSIDAFIVGIQDANARQTLDLTAALADGLARVKFLYTCFDAKVSRGILRRPLQKWYRYLT